MTHWILLDCFFEIFFYLNSDSELTGDVLYGIRCQRIKLQWDVSHNVPSCGP